MAVFTSCNAKHLINIHVLTDTKNPYESGKQINIDDMTIESVHSHDCSQHHGHSPTAQYAPNILGTLQMTNVLQKTICIVSVIFHGSSANERPIN